MPPLLAVAIVASMILGLAGMILIIAADRTRYLARFDFSHFHERQYLATLPNFLQNLNDAGFKRPWPIHLDALSAGWFHFRLRRILKARPALQRRRFVHQHLNLQALLFMLRPFIDDAILARQQKIAAERVVSMADNADRDRLMRFVRRAREYRGEFYAGLSKFDLKLAAEIQRRDLLSILRSANAMFHEHGYTFFPPLDVLRDWDTLEGSELVQVLPAFPKISARGAASRHAGLVSHLDGNLPG